MKWEMVLVKIIYMKTEYLLLQYHLWDPILQNYAISCMNLLSVSLILGPSLLVSMLFKTMHHHCSDYNDSCVYQYWNVIWSLCEHVLSYVTSSTVLGEISCIVTNRCTFTFRRCTLSLQWFQKEISQQNGILLDKNCSNRPHFGIM